MVSTSSGRVTIYFSSTILARSHLCLVHLGWSMKERVFPLSVKRVKKSQNLLDGRLMWKKVACWPFVPCVGLRDVNAEENESLGLVLFLHLSKIGKCTDEWGSGNGACNDHQRGFCAKFQRLPSLLVEGKKRSLLFAVLV